MKTIKRDYVAVYGAPDALTLLQNLPQWIEDYSEHHPHKASSRQESSAVRN